MKWKLYFLDCFFGSVVYLVIQFNRINHLPGFQLSIGESLAVLFPVYLISSFILLSPLLVFFRRKNKPFGNRFNTLLRSNILFIAASGVLLITYFKLFFKDLEDMADLFLSYGITGIVCMNYSISQNVNLDTRVGKGE